MTCLTNWPCPGSHHEIADDPRLIVENAVFTPLIVPVAYHGGGGFAMGAPKSGSRTSTLVVPIALSLVMLVNAFLITAIQCEQ